LHPHPKVTEVTELTEVTGDRDASRWSPAEAFLRARGAAEMPHPGGTLLAHLGRVRRLLAEWGDTLTVQAAGLCHAAYGTDGFDQTLAELIGDRAEALVYLYASCDRGVVHPRIGHDRPVVFRDRLTGREHTPAEADLRAFLQITAANELDVLAHDEELAERHGPGLYRLFVKAGDLLSAPARDACARQLGRHATFPDR
jgi:hypothetical protein